MKVTGTENGPPRRLAPPPRNAAAGSLDIVVDQGDTLTISGGSFANSAPSR